MKVKHLLTTTFFTSMMLLWCGLGWAQEWTYNFGTEEKVHTTGESITFLPSPQSDAGTARVRIGTQGGAFALENISEPTLQMRASAATGRSINRFSIQGYSAALTFYTKFSVLFSNGENGNWRFFQGSGNSISGNTDFTNADVFTGINWEYSSENAIEATYRSGSSWVAIPDVVFTQNVYYSLEIYGNNSTLTTSYSRAGSEYFLEPNKWDLWVDGVRVEGLLKAGMDDNVNIDGFSFSGGSSASNSAELNLFDFIYSNSFTSQSTPTISATPFTLANFAYIEETGPSPEKIFAVSGTNLEGDIVINAPASYEISETSGSGFGSSITLSETDSEVAETDIHVRLKAGLSVGDYNEDITISSLNASDKVVSLSGEVTPSSFQVTFSKLGEGEINAKVDDVEITSGSSVDIGSEIVFTATPADGYQVKQWTLNSEVVADNTSNELVVPSVDADVTVTVEFEPIEPDTYTVTFSVEGSNGTLTATADDNPISSGDDIVAGSTIVFSASPEVGFTIKEWSVNGDPLSEFTDNTYTIPSLTADVTVTVEFEPIVPETYSVTFSVVGDNGTLTAIANGVGISSGVEVEEGSVVEFVATPDEGFLVKVWGVNGNPLSDFTDNSYTINGLSYDVVVTVEFVEEEEEKYSVTFSVKAGLGNLVVSANGLDIVSGQEVAVGSTVVFSADPAPHYRVKEWVHNGEAVEGNTSNEYTIPSLDDYATVTVEFEEVIPVMYTVSFSVVEVNGNANGTLGATVNTFSIASGDEVEEGSTIIFTASPNDGYRLKEWRVNNDPLADYTDNTYTLTGLNANTNLTVEFEVITSVPSLALGGVRVYPNPFTNTISIANAESVARVIITDIIGKQVMAVTLNGETHINTSSLRDGAYLVILEDSTGQRVVRRLVKR